jgi:protein-S-isoprenylcysteine O-methyltransferase Ste14
MGGFFRSTRHSNYFGDVILFSGVSFISGNLWTAIIRLPMLVLFVSIDIPMLDAHLRAHYGAEFDVYARKTKKLIPFIY